MRFRARCRFLAADLRDARAKGSKSSLRHGVQMYADFASAARLRAQMNERSVGMTIANGSFSRDHSAIAADPGARKRGHLADTIATTSTDDFRSDFDRDRFFSRKVLMPLAKRPDLIDEVIWNDLKGGAWSRKRARNGWFVAT